jgi:hypothetical protein
MRIMLAPMRTVTAPTGRVSRTCHTTATVTAASTAATTKSARKPQNRMIHSPAKGATAVDTNPETP